MFGGGLKAKFTRPVETNEPVERGDDFGVHRDHGRFSFALWAVARFLPAPPIKKWVQPCATPISTA
jgi:hypothetical protein